MNNEIFEYIKQQRAQGANKEKISKELLSAGWQAGDIEKVFGAVQLPDVPPKKKYTTLTIAISLIAILLLAGGGFAYYYFIPQAKENSQAVEPPVMAQERGLAQQIKPSIQITSPQAGTVFEPGQSITVAIKTSPGLDIKLALASIPPDIAPKSDKTSPFEIILSIPNLSDLGPTEIVALAVDMDGNQFKTSLPISIKSPVPPQSIQSLPRFMNFIWVGLNNFIYVNGIFPDGIQRDVTDSLDVTFVSANPEVATVNTKGRVQAVGHGSTTITVSHAGLLTTIPVEVQGIRKDPLPFSSLTIENASYALSQEPVKDQFKITGRFVLGSGHNDMDWLNEQVIITFGWFHHTVINNSFVRVNDGFEFQGDSVQSNMQMNIGEDGRFDIIVAEEDLTDFDFSAPLFFSLRIGDDLGKTRITFDDQGNFVP